MQNLEAEIYSAVVNAGYRPSKSGQVGRAKKLLEVRMEHPEAAIVVVRDEFTGSRFGRSKRNSGRCKKLGNNSTTRGGDGSNCYQVWAKW